MRHSTKGQPVRFCRTCGKETERRSGRCGKCERALRVNGHPEQRGVTKRDLHPHLLSVIACRKRTADRAAEWANLDRQWDRIVEDAKAYIAEWRGGKASYRPQIRAAEEVVRLAVDVKAEDVTNVVLAMWSLLEFDGKLVKDDKAFLVQLVRQVRKLGTIGLGQRWDDRNQRTRRMYRAVPPRAVLEFAIWLRDAYGYAGVVYAHAEKARVERELEEKAKLRSSIGKLFDDGGSQGSQAA